MLATASRYDLDQFADRARSARDLVEFFFELSQIVRCDAFVEAGAKDATASRRAKKQWPAIPVLGFEANPYVFERFESVNSAAGVEYRNVALADARKPVVFNVHKDDDGNPVANGQASLLKREKSQRDRERGFIEVTVDGLRLDDALADVSFTNAAMWIDVEGACQFVLPGARDSLTRAAVVIVEVEDRAYWGTEHWLREQVVSYLYDLGLIPVARDFEYVHQGAAQYNIVFVRADLLTGATRVRSAIARFNSKAYDPPHEEVAATPVDTASPSTGSDQQTLSAHVRQIARSWLSNRSGG